MFLAENRPGVRESHDALFGHSWAPGLSPGEPSRFNDPVKFVDKT